MKRTCIALLCIAVLVARHAANAQENESVKSDELAKKKPLVAGKAAPLQASSPWLAFRSKNRSSTADFPGGPAWMASDFAAAVHLAPFWGRGP